MKIAYQGIEGSYSESCAKEMFPDCETISCKTFDDVFNRANEDDQVIAIIPESNKTTGNIGVEYLIFKYRLNIYAEHFFKVEHNLLGMKGSKVKDLRNVCHDSRILGKIYAEKKSRNKQEEHYKKALQVSEEIKDYALGLYGRAPIPLDPDVVELILNHRDATPVTGRPADLLEPELQASKDAVSEISEDIDDVLIYALYPATGMAFLRIKHGLDPVPDHMKAKSAEQIAAKQAQIAGQIKVTPSSSTPGKGSKSRAYEIYVGEQSFHVEVDSIVTTKSSNDSAVLATQEVTVVAPIPGIISGYAVGTGAQVGEGEAVVLLDAMNMENSLTAPRGGSVQSLPFPLGATVKKGDVLAIITP